VENAPINAKISMQRVLHHLQKIKTMESKPLTPKSIDNFKKKLEQPISYPEHIYHTIAIK